MDHLPNAHIAVAQLFIIAACALVVIILHFEVRPKPWR